MLNNYKNIFFYFAIIIFNVLVLFILLEFVVPKFSKTPHMSYRFWDNRPVTFYPNLLNRAVTGSYDTYFYTNSLGFNDVDHEVSNEDNIYRILLLGGSYVEAVGVEPKKHIARNLERLSKNNGVNIEVISMGMSGWGTAHQLATYERVGRQFKPDMVITFFVANDLHDNNRNQNTTKSNPPNRIYDFINNEIILNLNQNETPLTFKESILRKLNRFETYHVLRQVYKTFHYYFLVPKDDIEIANLITAPELIEKELTLDDWASDDDFIFFNSVLKKMKQEIIVKDKAKLVSVIVSGGINENMHETYFEFLNKIESIFINYDIQTTNFDRIFRDTYKKDGVLPHWETDAHWNKVGHRLVAEILYNNLKESINN